MSKAIRRHHRERLKKKRASYSIAQRGPKEARAVYLARALNTPKPCSCWACGNQRAVLGRSLAELRFYSEDCL